MKALPLDYIDLELKDVKTILHKKGKEINLTKITAKKNSLIVQTSDTVKLRISDPDGKIKMNPGFPTLGNPVQMVASLLFLFIFYAINFPVFIISAIVAGQLVSLVFFYPKALSLKKEVEALLKKNG